MLNEVNGIWLRYQTLNILLIILRKVNTYAGGKIIYIFLHEPKGSFNTLKTYNTYQ